MTKIELFGPDAKFFLYGIPLLLVALPVVSAFVALTMVLYSGILVLALGTAYFPIISAAFHTRGRHVEISNESLTLFHLGNEVWQISWSSVIGIEFTEKLGIALVADEEQRFTIPAFDSNGILRQAIVSHLPAGAFIRRRQLSFNIPPALGWLITVVGVSVLIWAIQELSYYMTLSHRLAETGDSAIESELSRFRIGQALMALILGIGVTLVGLFDRLAPRRQPKTTPIADDPALTLKAFLLSSRGKLDSLSPCTFVCKHSFAGQVRRGVVICLMAAIFFGSIMLGCFIGAILTRQGLWAALGVPYSLFVWWALAGVRISRRERDPLGWRIDIRQGEMWAISPEGSRHAVRIKKLIYDSYLAVQDLNGKDLFTPEYFVRVLDSESSVESPSTDSFPNKPT